MRLRTLIFAAAVLVAGPAAASADGRPMGPPPPHGLSLQIGHALSLLDLTSAQKEAIDGLLEARHEAMQAGHDEAMAAHTALRDAVLAESLDEGAVRVAAAAVASLLSDGAVADARLLRDVRAVLGADQREELDEILARPPWPHDGPPPGAARRRGAGRRGGLP